MADPTKLSYKDLVSWSKGENDITAKTAKTLATARTMTIVLQMQARLPRSMAGQILYLNCLIPSRQDHLLARLQEM